MPSKHLSKLSPSLPGQPSSADTDAPPSWLTHSTCLHLSCRSSIILDVVFENSMFPNHPLGRICSSSLSALGCNDSLQQRVKECRARLGKWCDMATASCHRVAHMSFVSNHGHFCHGLVLLNFPQPLLPLRTSTCPNAPRQVTHLNLRRLCIHTFRTSDLHLQSGLSKTQTCIANPMR